jgi:hypothetical protein
MIASPALDARFILQLAFSILLSKGLDADEKMVNVTRIYRSQPSKAIYNDNRLIR